MKKNQSRPPHHSVQELIKLYEQTATQRTFPENLSTKSASQHKKQSSSLKKQQQRHSVTNTSTNTEEEALSASATASSQKPPKVLSEEQIMQLLPHSQLVKSYREKLQDLCQSAYGNTNILQEKMEEIQKNPTLAESLSWQLTTHPESVSKLAGISFLGIKNRARRNAEENLSTLCSTLAGYGEAVKYAREELVMTPDAVLVHYEQSMGSEAIAKILQSSDHPERMHPPLSKAEISTMVEENSAIKRHHAQVNHWSKVVFGSSTIFTEKMKEILQNPAVAEEFTWQLAAYPQSLRSYAGLNLCGFKNSARRHAEAGLSHLIDAVDNYASAVNSLQNHLLQSHQKQQKHHDPSAQRAKSLQRQQESPKASKLPEYLSSTSQHESSQTSGHSYEKGPTVRPRKVLCQKTIAFSS